MYPYYVTCIYLYCVTCIYIVLHLSVLCYMYDTIMLHVTHECVVEYLKLMKTLLCLQKRENLSSRLSSKSEANYDTIRPVYHAYSSTNYSSIDAMIIALQIVIMYRFLTTTLQTNYVM